MAALTGISEDVKGRYIELDIHTVTVGRLDDNTVVIDNPTVSSHHAQIVRTEEGFALKDLGSTNGTRVNSRDVTEAQLRPQDTVQFGSIEFIFDDLEDTRRSRSPSVSTTKVTEETGAGVKPESFDSISPFGAEKKDSKRTWFVLITLIGLLALGVVIYYFVKLIGAS
jgi:pSer/pThr/pTyr-binding forkhead associated (FHA) protein